MGLEEQAEEREVLASIFPEEITEIDETSFSISILLDLSPDDQHASNPPTLLLEVTYPPAYPDEAPTLALSQQADSPSHPLLDLSASSEDNLELLSSLNATIEENLGMAMVYTLVMALKEAAEDLISQRIKDQQAQTAMVAAKAEEEENRKFVGTTVNRETFLAWRDKFIKELQDAEERKKAEEAELEKRKKSNAKEEPKLTGKQLWERGLVGKLADEDEEGEDGLEGVHIERLKVET